jgi:hypothetical protein
VAGPTSSPVPGQIVGQPTTTSGPVGAATGTPFQFQNPYGLPDTVRVPVVNPSANPYGLTPPAATTPATTPPATTTPPAPIKKSGTDGGQDAA